ncbi:transcription antitermination factor NusB [Microcella frigidaquae]|uniref:16S rRNA (Cytosine967-C5)-methyltransferase n=1 Tax=Microcella frigidaquae TaxID=424758 RepID=A0A840XED1_9MICO|nr:16S rRNA (cytosine967-C5)-methyltransferase [Microcella frigidaquae]NHN43872.1 rRNA small subunit methyltransferase B [Microcella frigidaquae]
MTPPDADRPPSPRRPARGGSRSASSPRTIALDVIRAVSADDAYANLVLPSRLRRARLSPGDAALATELTYGTLRRRGHYDRVIERAAARPLDTIDPVVRDILALGAHQLLGMRTPAHAAVDETVSLARGAGATRATGFINAVLRTISRADDATWVARLLDGVDDVDERLAVEHAHPAWVVAALRSALEREGRAGELEQLLAADNVPARVTLVALPGLSTPEQIGAPAASAPTAAIAAAGDPGAHPLVAAGRARVQDEGSQLAALALSRVRGVVPGERWIDLCAGPGGKAALLAAEAHQGGAQLVANEVVPARAGLVRQALAAVDPSVAVRVGDGRTVGEAEPGRYDRILLDAPCTGLGALRRRPEARWRKTAADVAPLAQLQGELLRSAVAALAPGGVLAYVTCSPHPAETTAIVDALLADPACPVTPLDTRAVLSRIACTPLDLGELPHGAAQLWPHRHGTDAMFIQLLQRA